MNFPVLQAQYSEVNDVEVHVGSRGHNVVPIQKIIGSELHLFIFSHCLSLSTQDEYEAILGCIEDALDLPNQPSECRTSLW